ncbi:DUF2139 domain-containing protein [Thermogladius sp.]|uniref:DUF2139 domain-containing protein n=1 Tax=Thermogladius sp. TaxID=2023064 RepID=UPI003D136E15
MDYLVKPGYGPEWGSGGVFGLTYYRKVLYYTLSMEAEAHFRHDNEETVYRFELLGPGPSSGGDTYNAVETVDEYIYFGGWVHNPAVYKSREGFAGEIDFRNKYSHVHEYNINEKTVRLVWSETARSEREWAGEVSEIVYDWLNDKLLLARADGHFNLGIFELDRSGSELKRLSDVPGLKGSLFLEFACFDMQPDWRRGVDGVQCYDPHEKRMLYYSVRDWTAVSVDGEGVENRGSGYAVSAYARYWHFFRGGLLVGNPVEPDVEEPSFVRLFDFPGTQYSPSRSNALVIAGGVLAAFNAYSHGALHVAEPKKSLVRTLNYSVGPSVLVYITPPVARIVLAVGARITSMTKRGGDVLLGTNNSPNLGGRDATKIDVGVREVLSVSEEGILTGRQPPVVFRVEGSTVGGRVFGGVPLTGYKEPHLRVYSSKPNTLKVSEYDLGLPPRLVDTSSYSISEGWNRVDLSSHDNIVSFKLMSPDEKAVVYIVLE